VKSTEEQPGADNRDRQRGKQWDEPVADRLLSRWNQGGGAAFVVKLPLSCPTLLPEAPRDSTLGE
jgi:hypothetical protein